MEINSPPNALFCQLFFEMANDIVFVHAFDESKPGTFVEVNSVACEVLGYSREELLQLTPLDIIPEADLSEVPGEAERLTSEQSLLFEKQLVTKAGQKIPVEINTRLFDHEGQPMAMSIARDISARYQAELQFRQSEARFRAFMQHIPANVYIKDAELRHVYANQNTLDTLQLDADTYVGTTSHEFHAFISEDMANELEEADRAVLATDNPHETELEITDADGHIRWERNIKFPIHMPTGETMIGGIALDITERKIAEAELRESHDLALKYEKLRASFKKEQDQNAFFQEMISYLHHDLKTPLTVIYTAQHLLSSYFERLDEATRARKLDQIGRQVEFATELIDDTVEVARGYLKTPFSPKTVDIALLCQVSIEEVGMANPSGHQLRIENPLGITDVVVDSTLVSRILMNLLTNAIKYSPGATEIVVELDRQHDDLIICVRDQGNGISEENLPRIFDPFFREGQTKGVQGTGLGLSIVKDCVDRHQGRIQVESEVGVGTTFTVTLPVGVATD